jgi:hypothetical protein
MDDLYLWGAIFGRVRYSEFIFQSDQAQGFIVTVKKEKLYSCKVGLLQKKLCHESLLLATWDVSFSAQLAAQHCATCRLSCRIFQAFLASYRDR